MTQHFAWTLIAALMVGCSSPVDHVTVTDGSTDAEKIAALEVGRRDVPVATVQTIDRALQSIGAKCDRTASDPSLGDMAATAVAGLRRDRQPISYVEFLQSLDRHLAVRAAGDVPTCRDAVARTWATRPK